MRIALTTPTTWPHVKRGGERFVNELAAFLADRGHDVTVIAAAPAGGTRRDHGYVTRCHRRWWHPALARVGVHEAHTFMASCLPRLLAGRYDLVQCSTFMEACSAALARRLTGTPCVLWVNSIPTPVKYVRQVSAGGVFFRSAMRQADDVIANSEYAGAYLEARFGRAPTVLPAGVDTGRFQPQPRLWRPIIVCAAVLEDERKGGALLMRAFNGVKRVCPAATLHVAAAVRPETERRLRELVEPGSRQDVHFTDMPSDAVPAAFREAAVSVLPSLWESFGVVVLESMACGTPVVGTRHGALPELIPNDDVGRLFDPGALDGASPTNVEGLTRALLDALELSRRPETAGRCRRWAEQFSWSVIGPKFEDLYSRIIERRRGAATAPHLESPKPNVRTVGS